MLFIFIPGTFIARGQVSKYPFRFSLYHNSASFVNPAAAGCNSDRELNLGSQQMFGAISHVSAHYFTFNIRIRQYKTDEPYSSIGIVLYNDREGKYLNRSRFYGSYTWHASVSRTLQFSAGFYVGGMNYSVKGTPLSGDGSDIKADGAVGVSLFSETFYVDMAFGQIFNSKVQPLEEITVLTPMINFSAYRVFSFQDGFRLVPSVSTRIPFNDGTDRNNKILTDVNLLFDMDQKLLFSAGIHNNTMMALAAGLSHLKISTGELGIMISYAFPALKRASIKTNFGEIGLNYYF